MIKYCIVTALTRVVVFSLLIGKKKAAPIQYHQVPWNKGQFGNLKSH